MILQPKPMKFIPSGTPVRINDKFGDADGLEGKLISFGWSGISYIRLPDGKPWAAYTTTLEEIKETPMAKFKIGDKVILNAIWADDYDKALVGQSGKVVATEEDFDGTIRVEFPGRTRWVLAKNCSLVTVPSDEPKFSVGDDVWITEVDPSVSPYPTTANNFTRGKIVETTAQGNYRVCVPEMPPAFIYYPNCLRKAYNFKEGDNVRILPFIDNDDGLNLEPCQENVGKVGEVISPDGGLNRVYVRVPGSGTWYYHPWNLELVVSEATEVATIKVGDRVRLCDSANTFCAGQVGTVELVDTDTVPYLVRFDDPRPLWCGAEEVYKVDAGMEVTEVSVDESQNKYQLAEGDTVKILSCCDSVSARCEFVGFVGTLVTIDRGDDGFPYQVRFPNNEVYWYEFAEVGPVDEDTQLIHRLARFLSTVTDGGAFRGDPAEWIFGAFVGWANYDHNAPNAAEILETFTRKGTEKAEEKRRIRNEIAALQRRLEELD